ncbi:ATP-binding protein [Streptomyces sp. NPDC051994]|uniref:ATP-binding protein n=1 Tax=unclassified Streptomyces TaxID=2593676 RepID=UPI003420C538
MRIPDEVTCVQYGNVREYGERSRLAEVVCRPRLAAEARHDAAAFLASQCPDVDTDTAQNLTLIVSELVTNAFRHADGVEAMTLLADRDTLRVIVEDSSPARPQERCPDLSGHGGGFGWPMVRLLAHRVSVLPRAGGGKAIEAVLAR